MMYRLDPPPTSGRDSYEKSISTISDEAKKSIFTAAKDVVVEKCNNFDLLVSSSKLKEAQPKDYDIKGVSGSDMSWLYDRRFMKIVATKAIRDEIKNAAPNSLCPYCGDGTVAELDHYLPKSKFAGLTTYPANLVPSCRDCNYAKSAFEPASGGEALLYPYLDPALDIDWLAAKVEKSESGGLTARFFVKNLNNTALEQRLDLHLEVFKLKDRYREKAAQILNETEDWLLQSTDPVNSLDIVIQMQGPRKNSWRTATYESIKESEWYINEYLSTKRRG